MNSTRSIADLLTFCFFLSLFCCASAAETPPNIVFIMSNELGYYELGHMGNKYIHSPGDWSNFRPARSAFTEIVDRKLGPVPFKHACKVTFDPRDVEISSTDGRGCDCRFSLRKSTTMQNAILEELTVFCR